MWRQPPRLSKPGRSPHPECGPHSGATMRQMPPRIAIPMPHSANRDYSERAIVQYEHAVEQAGGMPVRVPLDQTPGEVMKVIERCDPVLLPGSSADIDPAKFGAHASPHTA